MAVCVAEFRSDFALTHINVTEDCSWNWAAVESRFIAWHSYVNLGDETQREQLRRVNVCRVRTQAGVAANQHQVWPTSPELFGATALQVSPGTLPTSFPAWWSSPASGRPTAHSTELIVADRWLAMTGVPIWQMAEKREGSLKMQHWKMTDWTARPSE